MIGGLWKSNSSRLAILAATVMLTGGVSMSSAKAADLGGDCCADLEERVAELEATTARKGNRKMNLTITGQVTRNIMYYNDGLFSRTMAGLENRVEQSKFYFTGNSRINPHLTAGFELQIEIGLGATTSAVSNNPGPGGNTNAFGANNVDGNWGGDSVLDVRTANWWLEDKTLGRVTVGRINLGGPVVSIDLGAINTGATSRPALSGGSMAFRNNLGALSTTTIAAVFGPVYGGDRVEGIQYDSQAIAGFLFRAVWSEQDVSSFSVRYAGEFGGIQIAAGIGMLHQSSVGQLDRGGSDVIGGVGAQLTSQNNRALDEWSGSLAFKHVASGLFAQGHYAESDFKQYGGTPKASMWMVQSGVSKNWFGPGATAVFGEYGMGLNQIFGAGAAALTSSNSANFIGLGVNQKIDAAAMELYLGWRHFEASAAGPAVPSAASGLQALDIVMGGARIQF